MKVDYYLGVEPDSQTRMLLQGHFFKWYQIVEQHIDAKVITIPNGADFRATIKRKIFQSSAMPLLLQRRHDSLLHIISVNLVNQAVALIAKPPFVVTCFDAIIYEDNADKLAMRRSEQVLSAHKRIMRKANRVITISEHARSRLSAICDVDRETIDVVYLAVDHNIFYPRFLERSPETMLRFGFDPSKKNVLYVGSESPRKNLERIILALPLIKKHIDINFVIVGVSLEPYHSELQTLVHRLDLENVVNFYGPIPMSDLPIIYNLADVFVFPSLYEGFGLPPLEAMASGCPVVTSNATSLLEVVRDAAEIVDPYDHESIAAGILKVLSDEPYRQHLVQKGLEQALRFNWEKTASDILEVYHRVL